MAFFPPIPLIRKNHIVKRLKACGAISERTAKTLEEAGVIRPRAFSQINDRLVKQNVVARTPE